MNRRTLIRLSALAIPAGALAACGDATSTTTNGVTTITINVADLDNWGTAIINAASFIAPLVGPVGATILTIGVAAKAALAAVDTSAGGSLSLTFNSNSVPDAISSLLDDGRSVVSTVTSAVTTGTIPALASQAQEYLTAAETILSLFSAALGSVAATVPKMTEAAALATLGVK